LPYDLLEEQPAAENALPNEDLSPAGGLALNSDDLEGVPGEAYAPVREAVGTDFEEYATTGRRKAPPPSQLERKPGVVGRVKITVEETLSGGCPFPTGRPVISNDTNTAVILRGFHPG
jgi:hypothetical protein